MRLREDLVLRRVGQDHVIVDPGQDMVDMSKVFTLNDSAAWLWNQLIGKEFTSEEMVRLLTDQYEVLLTLLRLGLWEKHNVETFSSLSEAQWGLLYRYAQEQTIEGIVFDGIQHLPTQHLPPRALLLKWTVRIDQIERHNKQMNTVIKEQLSFFSAQGIHPFLLKGQGVASCYPIPEHRISGDVDWYFEAKEEYHRANDLIKQKRIKLTYTAGFSTEYAWNGIVIEHHCRMFDLYNPFSIPYLNQLEKRFKDQSIPMDLQGNTLLLPAPILMMLQVNAHILKHLLSFGLGIRQLCDAAKVYQQYRAEIDGQQLKEMYRKLGILKWIHLLHAVLVKYPCLLICQKV